MDKINSTIEIGTQFKRVGRKCPKIETVVDVLRTYNSAGELVDVKYVAEHEFMGQTVKDYSVVATTIKRGAI